MRYNLATFFHELSNGSFDILLLDLNVNGEKISMLQNELFNKFKNDKLLEKLVDSQQFKFHGKKEWVRFNIMVVSYLKYCRDVNPWSILESYDLIFNFHSDLVNCLLNDSYPIDDLVLVTKAMTEFIIPIASKLDENYLTMNTKRFQFLSHVSSIISKLFNSIKPMRNDDLDSDHIAMDQPSFHMLPEKQKILLYLVNKLNNIYFKIHSQQLCSNIFKNFKPKSMVQSFNEYPVQERIEFHYLLGRYYLLNNNILNAFKQLDQAFTMLSNVVNALNLSLETLPQLKRNLQRIIKYLVPTALIIGKLPKFWMLDKIDQELANNYRTLVTHIRAGNIQGMNQWLQLNEEQLRKDHLLLLMLEKLPMLTYRYLLRSVVQDYAIPTNSSRIPYPLIQHLLQLSIGDQAQSQSNKVTIFNGIHSHDNVENILVNLINLNLFRGNCFPILKTCVIKRTNNINEVFPQVTEKIVTMFPLNNDDSWLDI